MGSMAARASAVNWELVDGRMQTRLPSDSWTIAYVNGREPVVWHHEVFHADLRGAAIV